MIRNLTGRGSHEHTQLGP